MERILKKVEKSNSKLFAEFEKHKKEIIDTPLCSSLLKGDLKDFRSFDFKYQQVSLRICYSYNVRDNHVTFFYFGTRENFYQEVKRYLS